MLGGECSIKRIWSFRQLLLTGVVCIALPLAVLLIFNSIYSIRTFNERLAESNQRTVDACARQIEDQLAAVDEAMTAVVARNVDFITLSGGASSLQAHLSALALYGQLKPIMPSYSAVGAFFLYSVPSKTERDMFRDNFTYPEKVELRQFVREAVSKDAITMKMGWRWARVGGEAYLFRFFGGRGTYLVAMAPLNLLLDSTEWKLEQEAVAAFTTLEHVPLTQENFIAEQHIDLEGDYSSYFLSGSPKQYMIIGRRLENADCNLVFLVGGSGYLESLDSIQNGLLAFSLLAVLALPFLMLWLNRLLIKPVGQLKVTIERIHGGDLEAQAPTEGQVLEFRQVNETFNTMMGQIKKLKIESYEKELEAQKAQLRYLQLQIRPHFFLNGLKGLYAMAQQQEYSKMQQMIVAFTRHIRYIFQDNLSFVPLERELDHVRNYVELQAFVAAHPPRLSISADLRLMNFPVPPLSIQTFVENSIKHKEDPDFALEIDVKASLLRSEGQRYIDLTVSDNGKGFSDEILQEINSSSSEVYTSRHVGLNNVKNRIKLLYGEGVMYAFFNTDPGCVSEILIPVEEKDLDSPKEGGAAE